MIDWPDLEARNARLCAFTDFDRAAHGGSGALAAVTMGIKANIAVRGLPWTAGMALHRGKIAGHDAMVVARLRGAGATILGTLNLEEAALGAATDNPWFGRTINPHRAGFTPGGSSGGSGAAVAAGLCDAALGTDTLGSIRIPAAYCGVYGLKPTPGLVPDDGLIAVDRGLDCIGPLARDLDMLERVWAVMIGAAAAPAQPAARILVLAGHGGVAMQPAVLDGFDRALAAVGAAAETLTLPDAPGKIRHAGFVQAGQALLGELGDARQAQADLLSDSLKFLLDTCARTAPNPALLARNRAVLRAAIGDDGVLLLPTAPQVAFAHGQRAPANQADFTCLASVAGLPALALPSGRDASGLPVGVQLVGPPDGEALLFATARAVDRALNAYAPPP